METNKKNQLFMSLERERGWVKDLGLYCGGFSLFYSFYFIKYVSVYLYMYACACMCLRVYLRMYIYGIYICMHIFRHFV